MIGFTTPFWTILLLSLMWFVGAPALGFFYACTIVLLAEREPWKKSMAPLAAVGRLTLSNYLFQSVIHAGLFFSYGFGLYGKVGPVGGLALAVVVFTIQVFLSMWWIWRFRFGPAEWLWRSLTYGQMQPMRVQQPGN